jgi:hypothetical protein
MASTKSTYVQYTLLPQNANINVLSKDQEWVLTRMLKLFPYTCWDTSILSHNIKKYIVRSVQVQLPRHKQNARFISIDKKKTVTARKLVPRMAYF